jgi:hypothetical protein
MQVTYVPLLQQQRNLYSMPNGMERFRRYLSVMTNQTNDGLVVPPLALINPMGKEHLHQRLDELLAIQADASSQAVVTEMQSVLVDIPGNYHLSMVLADDAQGGWTNRYDYEYQLLCPQVELEDGEPVVPQWTEHRWLTSVLWASDPVSERRVQQTIRCTLYRAAYQSKQGIPQSLREMMQQEGQVLLKAGCLEPCLDPDEVEYTREVISPFLQATDKRTIIECLFGDPAGATLGFTPRGLSLNAGLALALHDAQVQ